jgi:hypothetical protein
MSYVNPADFIRDNKATSNGEKHCVTRTYADGTIATAPVSPKAITACAPILEAYSLATDKQTIYLVRDHSSNMMYRLVPADESVALPLSLTGRFTNENTVVRLVKERCNRLHRSQPVDDFTAAKRCKECKQFHVSNEGCATDDVPVLGNSTTLLALHKEGLTTGIPNGGIEVTRGKGYTILSTVSSGIQLQCDGESGYAWQDEGDTVCVIHRPSAEFVRYVSLWQGCDEPHKRELGFLRMSDAVEHIHHYLGKS